MWRHLAHSLQGTSHSAEGSPCQDSHRVLLLGGEANDTLVACAADGAGSAKHSSAGSSIACERITANAAAYLESHGSFDLLQIEDVWSWCEDARRTIEKEAEARASSSREFATTICTAIVSPQRACFFQIGDGAIIAGARGVLGVVFWPQSGEYANSTNFLTAEDFRTHLEFVTTESQFSELALFTDGLERLALTFESQTPFPPFFHPLFQVLRTADDPAGLGDDFRRFLQSDSVQARSDDDKTLILVTQVAEENDQND
ncbi:MAG: protein phosphatase 2C domain-containing protein [Planctomycetales bacterium]|nr:protein phosphatase 2C domain-containing protein [Planctomycetales bacterium]